MLDVRTAKDADATREAGSKRGAACRAEQRIGGTPKQKRPNRVRGRRATTTWACVEETEGGSSALAVDSRHGRTSSSATTGWSGRPVAGHRVSLAKRRPVATSSCDTQNGTRSPWDGGRVRWNQGRVPVSQRDRASAACVDPDSGGWSSNGPPAVSKEPGTQRRHPRVASRGRWSGCANGPSGPGTYPPADLGQGRTRLRRPGNRTPRKVSRPGPQRPG